MRKRVIQAFYLFIITVLIGISSMDLQMKFQNTKIQKIVAQTINEKSEKGFESCVLLIKGQNISDKNAVKVFNYEDINIFVYENKEDTELAYDKFSKMSNVLSIETDKMIYSSDTEMITEELLIESSKTNETRSALGNYIDKLPKKQEVIVAVLDTGLDKENFSDKNRILDKGLNLSSDGTIGNSLDNNGHGSKMAELIAQNTSSMVKILPVKIADKDGKATILSAYGGIKTAIEYGADVILLSMNTVNLETSVFLQEVIGEAVERDISVVVSAGNKNSDTEYVTPSNIKEAIVISATDKEKEKALYSNYGMEVDYSAYGSYKNMEGTSFAAARVAGIIAELKASGIEEVEQTLDRYAKDLGMDGKDKYYGKGYLSFYETEEADSGMLISESSKTEHNIGAEIMKLDWKALSTEELDAYLGETDAVYVGMFFVSLTEEEMILLREKSNIIHYPITTYRIRQSLKTDTYITKEIIETNFVEYCIEAYQEAKEELSISWTAANDGVFYLSSPDRTTTYKYTVTGMKGKGYTSYAAENGRLFEAKDIYITASRVKGTGSNFPQPAVSEVEKYAMSINAHEQYFENTKTHTTFVSKNYALIDIGKDYGRIYYGLGIKFVGYKNKKEGYHTYETDVLCYNYGTNKPAYSYNLEQIEYDSNGKAYLKYYTKETLPTEKRIEQIEETNFNDLNNYDVTYYYNGTFLPGYNSSTPNVSHVHLEGTWLERTANIYINNGKSTMRTANQTGSFTLNVNPPLAFGWTWTMEGKEVTCNDVPEYVFPLVPNTYYIDFVGGTGSTGDIPTMEITYDTTFALTKNNGQIKKEGYKFSHWAVVGNTTTYTDGQGGLKNLTTEDGKTIKLQAVWTPIESASTTYTIKYDGNGATSGSMSDTTAAKNEGIILKNNFKREFTVAYSASNGTFTSNNSNSKSVTVSSTFEGWLDRNAFFYDGVQWEWWTFDAPYYANNRTDIRDAYGYNKQLLAKNYFTYVIHGSSNVNGSEVFNISEYMANNSALANRYDKERFAMTHHWDEWGYLAKLTGKNTDDTNKKGSDGKYLNVYPLNSIVSNLCYEKMHTVILTARWTDKSVTLPKASEITRDGYTLLGWSTKKNPTKADVEYNPGASVLVTSNMQFYAVWEPKTVTVTFHKNDGSSVSKANTYTYDVSGQKLIDPKWTRIGYKCLGWATSSSAAKADFSMTQAVNNAFILKYTPNLNLYLVWELETYTISYDLDGGTLPSGKTNPTSYNVNTTTFTLNNPTKTGYKFKGWTGSNGTTAQTSVSVSKGSTGNKSYKANWELITYTIAYDLDGGTLPSGKTNPTSYNVNTAVFSLNNPTKKGYKFIGWTGSNGTTAQTTVSVAKGSTGNKSYKANWEIINYSISYDLDGGSLPSGKTNPISYNITTPAFTLNNPVKRGYTFLGWTGSNGTTPQKTVSITKGSTENKSYKANWKVNKYTLTLDHNGGTYNGESKSAYVVTYDSSDYNDISNRLPKRTGYQFDGYWTEKNGGTQVYTKEGKAINDNVHWKDGKWYKDGDATLYAQWTANTYTLQFHPNEGEIVMPISEMTITYGTSVILPNGSPYYVKYTMNGENVTSDVLAGNIMTSGSEAETVMEGVLLGEAAVEETTLTEDGELTEEQTLEEVAETEEGLYETELLQIEEEPKAYPSLFAGWVLESERNSFKPKWKAEETSVNQLVEEAGVADSNHAVITLYAVWDDCPWIIAEDLYYTLEEAQNGFITYEELMNQAEAYDREDGSDISPGEDVEKGTSFTIIDYQPSDFTQFLKDGSVTETYQVIDSAGSEYQKMITVHIVDTTAVEIKPEGTTRFINEKYYKESYENGGLEENSIWKINAEYRETIEEAFENSRNNTPLWTFEFSYEEILKMKEYVRQNGVGNYQKEDALQKFYQEFIKKL